MRSVILTFALIVYSISCNAYGVVLKIVGMGPECPSDYAPTTIPGKFEKLTVIKNADGFERTNRHTCWSKEYHQYMRNTGLEAIRKAIGTDLTGYDDRFYISHISSDDEYIVCFSPVYIVMKNGIAHKKTLNELNPLQKRYAILCPISDRYEVFSD